MKLLFNLGVWKASIKSRMAAIERQVFIANGNKKCSCGCLSAEDQDLEEEDDDDDFQGTFGARYVCTFFCVYHLFFSSMFYFGTL